MATANMCKVQYKLTDANKQQTMLMTDANMQEVQLYNRGLGSIDAGDHLLLA